MATTRTGQDSPIDRAPDANAATASAEAARSRTLLDLHSDAICCFQPDLTLTYANDACRRVFGRSADALRDCRFIELFPEEIRSAAVAQVAGITPANATASIEHVVMRPESTSELRRWDISGLFSNRGELIEYHAVGRDVTAFRALEAELRACQAQLARLSRQRDDDLVGHEQTERSLRESEERFRELAENIHEAFWLSEPYSRRVLYASPASERVWGIPPAQMYANPRAWIDAAHPEDRPAVEATVHEQCRGRATDCEFRVLHPDGRYRWIRNRAFPVRSATGEIYRIAGIAEDVTARHDAEVALRSAHEYLESIINCVADPIFVKNRRHEMVLVNDAECVLTGWPRAQVLGRTDHDFFPKEQVDVFWAMDEEVFNTGRENINEEQITDASGRTRTIVTRKTLYTDRAGGQFIVGVIRDITERKRVENELLRIRKAVESSGDGVAISDLSLRHVYQNQAFYGLFGYTVDELNALGGPKATFVDPDAADELFETISSGRSWQGEAEMRTARGTIVPVLIRADAIKDAEGRTVALVGIMTDITERKRAQEADRRHREEMAHAARLSTVGEMASGLAHEMAQPLSAILYFARGCITRMEQGHWGIHEAAEAIRKIALQAERAGEFIHRLKAYVRKAQPQCVPTSLNAIVRDSLAMLAPQLRSTRTSVQLNLDDAIAQIYVDPIQIEQVVLNLVRNGLEAMEPIPPAARRLRIRTYPGPGPTTCFEVRDSGTGITPQVAGTLFDPFFTTKPNGTGLGLPISRTLIEEMYAGRLWVEPDSEVGVRAGFSLPIAPEQ